MCRTKIPQWAVHDWSVDGKTHGGDEEWDVEVPRQYRFYGSLFRYNSPWNQAQVHPAIRLVVVEDVDYNHEQGKNGKDQEAFVIFHFRKTCVDHCSEWGFGSRISGVEKRVRKCNRKIKLYNAWLVKMRWIIPRREVLNCFLGILKREGRQRNPKQEGLT